MFINGSALLLPFAFWQRLQEFAKSANIPWVNSTRWLVENCDASLWNAPPIGMISTFPETNGSPVSPTVCASHFDACADAEVPDDAGQFPAAVSDPRVYGGPTV